MTRAASELAEFLGCSVEGDARTPVSGVAAPELAGPGDLIYVAAARHLPQAESSRAICALIGPGLSLAGKTLLRTANPKLAFARAAQWLLPAPVIAAGVHPTAIISSSATLGEVVGVGPYVVIEDHVHVGAGTQIGAHSFLGRGARIGARSVVYPRVTIYPGVIAGDGVILHSGVVLGADGFGYVEDAGHRIKFPQIGALEIGDEVEIGANTTVDRGSLQTTKIAAGVKIDNLVHIAHNVTIGENTVMAAQVGVSGSAVIGRNVAFGGQAGLGEGCVIEDGAVIGGQTGVLPGKKIRSGQTVWGTPARPLDRFREQFAWLGRLPGIAKRLTALEEKLRVEQS